MTHRPLALAPLLAALALLAPSAEAGIPIICWSAEMEPPPGGCQFRFHPQGQLDELVIHVTLRDQFCIPVADCSTSATVTANAGTLALCSCDGLRHAGFSDAAGVIDFAFGRIGGRGDLTVGVTAHCAGDIGIADFDVSFTSPDQDGSCGIAPQWAVNVIDMGIWAAGLGSYLRTSDFNCDGVVGVIDLGMWASGLWSSCEAMP